MKTATCPNCASKFKPSINRAYKGVVKDYRDYMHSGRKVPEKWIDESSMVRCPNCGNEFKSEAVRFFGLLSPKGLKIFIGIYVFGFICFALWALVSAF
jgi:hypothetical protein